MSSLIDRWRTGVVLVVALLTSSAAWSCMPQVPNFTVFGTGAAGHPANAGPSLCDTIAPVMQDANAGFGGSWQNMSLTADAGRFGWSTHGYNATMGDATYYGSAGVTTRFLVTGPAESIGLSLNLEAVALNEVVSGASDLGGGEAAIRVSIFEPGGTYLLNQGVNWDYRATPGMPVETSLASMFVAVPTDVELVLQLVPSPAFYMNQVTWPTPAEFTNVGSVELRTTDVFSFDAEGFSVHMPGLNVYDNQWLGPDPPGLHPRFLDVPTTHWAFSFIEAFSDAGITAGCGGFNYCPDDAVTRAQMAVFLLRAKHGTAYTPPAAMGAFADVGTNYWAAAWIEQLAAEGITGGCGNDNYCPNDTVTRAQMAVFLVRTFNL